MNLILMEVTYFLAMASITILSTLSICHKVVTNERKEIRCMVKGIHFTFTLLNLRPLDNEIDSLTTD